MASLDARGEGEFFLEGLSILRGNLAKPAESVAFEGAAMGGPFGPGRRACALSSLMDGSKNHTQGDREEDGKVFLR